MARKKEHDFSVTAFRVVQQATREDQPIKEEKIDGKNPHAVALGIKIAGSMSNDESVVITLSGRGDKDLSYVLERQDCKSNAG